MCISNRLLSRSDVTDVTEFNQNAARLIRSLKREDNYLIVVEHDLSVLDYLSE